MATQKHIIRQQIISIEMAGNNSVVAIQDTAKNVFYTKLLPKLDVLFSKLITNETIVRIDKIEIDIGKINNENFELELVEKSIIKIEKELTEKLQLDVSTSSNVNIITQQQSVINELIYFLEHGYFSWYSRYKSIHVLEEAFTAKDVTYNVFKRSFLNLITEKNWIVQRLIFQFSDNFLHFLSQLFVTDLSAKDLLQVIQKNLYNHAQAKDESAVRNYFWQIVFKNLSLQKDQLQLKIISGTLRFIASIQNSDIENIVHSFSKTKLPAEIIHQLKKIFEKEIKEEQLKKNVSPGSDTNKNAGQAGIALNETAASFDTENKTSLNDANEIVSIDDDISILSSIYTNEQDLSAKINDVKAAPVKNITNETPDTEEPVYLDFAGLVIIHHFLLPFFTELRLIVDKRFLNETALHKAIQLLGYLATGETHVDEPYLILPKLLCGININTPVQKDIFITNDEKQECDMLLKQVIEHWPALKNTSPNGLRNSFLKREGKLTRGGLGWQLDIEHKTWDILLTKLPWGYSLIKLPWMKEFLFVNWS